MRLLLLLLMLPINLLAAPYICGDTGLIYDSQGFCSSACTNCTALVSSETCSSNYKNHVYDETRNITYAVSVSSGSWTSFTSSAIVRDSSANAVLKSITNYSGLAAAWIGLYDPDKSQNLGSSDDTRFKWRDGSLLNYRNWASGQPDNAFESADIGTVSVYGEHWVIMGNNGQWSDVGEHSGQALSYPALVEFSGQLGCVKGTIPAQETAPEDIITSFCATNPDKCYLCTDTTDIYQCTAGTSGGYLCPKSQIACDAQWANSSCSSGGVLTPATDKCELSRNVTCPTGMSFDTNLEVCVLAASCSSGGVLNTITDLCEITLSSYSCPAGYVYDAVNNGCTKTPDCSSGSYIATNDRCEFAVTYTCPSGYSYNSGLGICEAAPVCTNGTYNTAYNKCLTSATLSCPVGYTQNGAICQAVPSCTSGSYNTVTNRCESGNTYTCSLGGSYSDSASCSTSCNSTINATATSTYKWILTFPDYDTVWGDYNSATYKTCTVDLKTCWTYGPMTRGGAYFIRDRYWATAYKNDGSIYLCLDMNGTYNYTCSTTVATSYPEGTSYSCPYGWSITGYNGDLCNKTGTCTVGSCPSGTTASGSLCVSSPNCPSGGILNTSTDKCEIATINNCPSGMTWDSALNYCVASPVCLNSGTLNTVTDKCNLNVTTSCPSGYNISGSVCYSAPICSSGSYNSTLNLCLYSASNLCPAGYSFDSSTDKCKIAPYCSVGSYSTTIDKCSALPTISCSGIYSYNSASKICQSDPSCSSGTYNTNQNQCFTGYACPFTGQPCIELNSQWLCSKYGCYDANDQSNYAEDDTAEGTNDVLADGEKDNSGNCIGTIYIFNGNDRRCRKSGVQTGFSDCCKKKKDWFGLAKCNPTEQLLSTLRNWGELDGQCHEIGEYCSSKFLGVCVQKKKTYCCFGSPLARIIQEQGRPQLNIGWGDPKSPNCSGFTPEEFQKLDFSKISFDEWINEYVAPELTESITDNIKETFENITMPTQTFK